MTKRERLHWDWLVRRFTVRGLARKYRLTMRQVEDAIRLASRNVERTGYP